MAKQPTIIDLDTWREQRRYRRLTQLKPLALSAHPEEAARRWRIAGQPERIWRKAMAWYRLMSDE